MIMNYFEVEELKKRELLSKLKKVEFEDFNNMEKGTKLINKRDNNIHNMNLFSHYHDGKVFYETRDKKVYFLGLSDWYYLDENLVDEIEDEYCLKLFKVGEKLYVDRTPTMLEVNLGKKVTKENIVYNVDGFDIVIK